MLFGVFHLLWQDLHAEVSILAMLQSWPLVDSWERGLLSPPIPVRAFLPILTRASAWMRNHSHLLSIQKNLSPPGPQFGIGRFIRLFSIMQGCLDILVPQPLADRRQADPSIDQLSGMGVAKLV